MSLLNAGLGYLAYKNRDKIGDALNKVGLNGASAADEAKMARQNAVGANAQQFGEWGADNYAGLTGRLNGSLDALQATANGQNSVSALQLQQALQQNLNAQRAMAAGAAPGAQAMASRTAAMQMGRMGTGLAGQQALAGLQERQQAQQAYAQMLGAARGQDVQAALGGQGNAINAYSGGLNGQRDPTLAGQFQGAIQGGAKFFGMGG